MSEWLDKVNIEDVTGRIDTRVSVNPVYLDLEKIFDKVQQR